MNGPVTASIFGPYSPAVKRLGSPSTSLTSSASATTVTSFVAMIGLCLRMKRNSPGRGLVRDAARDARHLFGELVGRVLEPLANLVVEAHQPVVPSAMAASPLRPGT